MHIRILTTCTGEKSIRSGDSVSPLDFEQGQAQVALRCGELAATAVPAALLYAGRQHTALMRAVNEVRARPISPLEIEVAILSAGFGLVSEDQPLPSYEFTFSGMAVSRIRRCADDLGIPAAVSAWLAQPADLLLVLLSDPYLEAAAIRPDQTFGGPTLLFCGTVAGRTLPEWDEVRKVVLSRADARRLGQGLVWLKGYLAGALLLRLAAEPGLLPAILNRDQAFLDLLHADSRQAVLLL